MLQTAKVTRWNLLGLSAESRVCIEPTFRRPSRSSSPSSSDRDGPRNVGSIQTRDAADNPKRFHRI